MLRDIARAPMFGHDRGLHLLGRRNRAEIRPRARSEVAGPASASRFCSMQSALRQSATRFWRFSTGASASLPGTTRFGLIRSAVSITARTASRSSSTAGSRSPVAPASPITGWATRRTVGTGATFNSGSKARRSFRCKRALRRTGCRRRASSSPDLSSTRRSRRRPARWPCRRS